MTFTFAARSFSVMRCLMVVSDWLDPGLITGRGGRSRDIVRMRVLYSKDLQQTIYSNTVNRLPRQLAPMKPRLCVDVYKLQNVLTSRWARWWAFNIIFSVLLLSHLLHCCHLLLLWRRLYRHFLKQLEHGDHMRTLQTKQTQLQWNKTVTSS